MPVSTGPLYRACLSLSPSPYAYLILSPPLSPFLLQNVSRPLCLSLSSQTYDELLIHEPADWLYDKITATPISDAPPHPLSPFFIEPNESEERQLQLYLGLQGYVQARRSL